MRALSINFNCFFRHALNCRDVENTKKTVGIHSLFVGGGVDANLGVLTAGEFGVGLKSFLGLVVTGVEVVLFVSVSSDLSGFDVCSGQAELALGQTHAAEELYGVVPFLFLSLLAPFELAGHDVNDVGKRLEGGLGVEEGETCATGNDINCGLGRLVAHGVSDLTVDEGVEGRDTLTAYRETLLGGVAKRGDLPGTIAIGFSQVLGNLGLDTKVLDDVDEEGLAPAVRAEKLDLVSLA